MPFHEDPYTLHWRSILTHGIITRPREENTRELLNRTFVAPADYMPGRSGYNTNLAFLEMWQMIAGSFSLEYIHANAPKANLELFEKQSDYGPRIREQLERVLAELINDPYSRRASVVLPRRHEAGGDNLTCTTALQFLIRAGQLHCVATMRSSDAWFGLPYDQVMFGGLTQALAAALQKTPGEVYINIGSAHIYQPHWNKHPDSNLARRFTLHSLPDSWPGIRAWARFMAKYSPWKNAFKGVLGIKVEPYHDNDEIPF